MATNNVPPDTDPRCGTRAGYFAHRRNEQAPCKACKDANAAVTAPYDKARAKAAGRLVKAHREEYLRYVAEERELQDAAAGDAR